MDAINSAWKALADKGLVVEIKGEQVRLIDEAFWKAMGEKRMKPTFPDGYGPVPNYELMQRTVTRTRLWKKQSVYCRQKVVECAYELKPEVLQ